MRARRTESAAWLRWRADSNIEDIERQVRGRPQVTETWEKTLTAFGFGPLKISRACNGVARKCRRGHPQARAICCSPRDRCDMQASMAAVPHFPYLEAWTFKLFQGRSYARCTCARSNWRSINHVRWVPKLMQLQAIMLLNQVRQWSSVSQRMMPSL